MASESTFWKLFGAAAFVILVLLNLFSEETVNFSKHYVESSIYKYVGLSSHNKSSIHPEITYLFVSKMTNAPLRNKPRSNHSAPSETSKIKLEQDSLLTEISSTYRKQAHVLSEAKKKIKEEKRMIEK